jgi:hypothetical protein
VTGCQLALLALELPLLLPLFLQHSLQLQQLVV